MYIFHIYILNTYARQSRGKVLENKKFEALSRIKL